MLHYLTYYVDCALSVSLYDNMMSMSSFIILCVAYKFLHPKRLWPSCPKIFVFLPVFVLPFFVNVILTMELLCNYNHPKVKDFICNRLTEADQYTIAAVAINCTVVGSGPKGKNDMLARVTVVDEDGNVLFNKCVRPTERVTNYRTSCSGVCPYDLKVPNCMEIEDVQDRVKILIADKILVGHSLLRVFSLLSITYPQTLCYDTQTCPVIKLMLGLDQKPDFRSRLPGVTVINVNQPIVEETSLKFLSERLLNIEVEHCGEHVSVQYARSAMSIYKMIRMVRKMQESEQKTNRYMVFNLENQQE